MRVRPPDAERLPDAKVSADFEEIDERERQCDEQIAAIRQSFLLYRPENGPRQVFFRIVVKLLDNINMDEQRFDVTMDLHLQWMMSEEDARMWIWTWVESKSMSAPIDKDGKVKTWSPPKVELPTTATATSVQVHSHNIDVLGDLLVGSCIHTIKGTFAEPMELENFPFDCQPLQLRLTFPLEEDEVHIHPEIPAAGNSDIVTMTQDRRLLTEYELHRPIVAILRTSTHQLAGNMKHVEMQRQTIVLQLQVSRLWRGYVYRVVITIAMVSASAVLGYWIPARELGDRMAYLGAIFLTAIAYQGVLADMLPRLGYATLLDAYILHTSIFVVLGMCLMAFTFWLTEQAEPGEDDGRAEAVDTSCRAIMIVLWLAMHALFAARAAYALLYIERPKLDRLFEVGERQQRPLTADSLYVVKKDALSRVFLGTAERWQGPSLRKAKVRRDSCPIDWAGTWHSDDFQGPDQYVAVFVQKKEQDNGSLQLIARKIPPPTNFGSDAREGHQSVPCGRRAWIIDGIPEVDGGAKKCEIRLRVREEAEQQGECLSPTPQLQARWWWDDAEFEVRAVSRDCLKFSATGHPDITFHRWRSPLARGATNLSSSGAAI